jgi:radical SAM protein with 4Fe4S-binding SPASM domain
MPVDADYPRAIYLELTDRCNLTCPMCRTGKIKGDILPLRLFREIAEELFPHAVYVDLRGWGESTILSNFEDYLGIAQTYPVKVKLITNATVKKHDLWERLGRDGVIVGVSFDAAEGGMFEKLRRGAKMSQVVENIKTMVLASRKSGRDPAEQIYLCVTVSGSNINQLADIVILGRSLGLRRFKLEPLWAPDHDPDRLEHHQHAVHSAVQGLKEVASETGAFVEYSASLLPELTNPPATQKLCIHPWEYCYINARGRIGFCDHLNGREEFAWGEWGKQAFLEYWNGDRMKRLRAEHLSRLGGEPIVACADCNWCYDRRYMDLEDWIAPKWAAYRVRA